MPDSSSYAGGGTNTVRCVDSIVFGSSFYSIFEVVWLDRYYCKIIIVNIFGGLLLCFDSLVFWGSICHFCFSNNCLHGYGTSSLAFDIKFIEPPA